MIPIFPPSSKQPVHPRVKDVIYYFGFKDYETKPTFYGVPMNQILTTINYDFSYPLILYLWLGSITPLETMMHEDVSYINEKGLHIYLYEPMRTYVDENGLNRSQELDSIEIYIKNNNITNVTVHTCEYRCDVLFNYYNTHMKLLCDDIYIKTATTALPSTIPTDKFTKKFISLNKRYSIHRNLTAAYVANKSGYCSWNYVTDMTALKNNQIIRITELDELVEGKLLSGLEYLNANSPLIVDSPKISPIYVDQFENISNPYPFNSVSRSAEKYYADVFCAIETESVFSGPAAGLSEKTFRAISYNKPFILVAAIHALQYLKTLGFKTFSDFWDESYDEEPDHTLRLAKIFKVIDYIDGMTIDELKSMYDSMRPILEHNNRVLHSMQIQNTTLSMINSKLKQVLWVYNDNTPHT